MNALTRLTNGIRVFACDLASGLFVIAHNGLALVGLGLVFGAFLLAARADLRDAGEQRLRAWLHTRLTAAEALIDEDTSDRALAANPRELPRQQASVTYWLSRKYRVAAEPLSVIVAEAWSVGSRTRLDPTLLLAVMAVESSFNPFAQSAVGAQGLMQVMTRLHSDKYEHTGGPLAAFHPVVNLHVGANVLLECIERAGSIRGGLKHYVGAANLDSDGGYAAKVLAEQARLQQVAAGAVVPLDSSAATTTPVAAPKPKAGSGAGGLRLASLVR